MTTVDRIKEDLDFVAGAVRQQERPSTIPAIYFMWALIVAVGFALPDFAPRMAGFYWLVCGIGGGLISWWLSAREARREGINDSALGRRHAYHWLAAGLGMALCWLPIAVGRFEVETGVSNFLLVIGLTYVFAGVHLDRPLLLSGMVMLTGYALLALFTLPYIWTITGLVIAVSLSWAGWARMRADTAPP